MAYRTRWTRLLSRAELAATAVTATALLAAVGCTSGPATGASGTTKDAAPPVTAGQAARAYDGVVSAYLAAPVAGHQAAALSSATDVARVVLTTAYKAERYDKLRLPAGGVRVGKPVFYLPDSAGYPQWFVTDVTITYPGAKPPPGTAITGTPGGVQWIGRDGGALLLFTKASATGGWQLSAESYLVPGESAPVLASDASGHVPVVSLSDTALTARPDYAGPLQAAVVDDGPASPAARVVAGGPLTTGIYDNERAGLLGLSAPRGDVRQWELEGTSYRQFALRTSDGGALVFYAMYLNTTVQTPAALAQSSPPLPPGPPISVPASLAPLLPRGQRAPRVELEGQQLLSFAAVDPPAGSGKIQVIAIGGNWSYASTAS